MLIAMTTLLFGLSACSTTQKTATEKVTAKQATTKQATIKKSTADKTASHATSTDSMTINSMTINAMTIEEMIKAYIKENGNTNAPANYQVVTIDLAKGKQIYLVNIEDDDWCGTGGCAVLLIEKMSNDNFRVMNEFIPIQGFHIRNEVKNDWKVLDILIGDGSSSETQRYVYNDKSKMYQLIDDK